MTTPNSDPGNIQVDADKVNRRLLNQLVAALAADPGRATERIGDALLEGVQWREAFDAQSLELARSRAELAALRTDTDGDRPVVVDADPHR